jgi:hypothetical protein
MATGGEALVRNTINNPRPQLLSEDNLYLKADENIQG